MTTLLCSCRMTPSWLRCERADDAESGLAHESGATTIRIGGGAAAAGRDGGLGGVFGFGCRAGPSRQSAWWMWAGLVALGLLVRRRRRRGPSASAARVVRLRVTA